MKRGNGMTRVLVVDDDPLAGELVAAILEDRGHEAMLAESGAQAQGMLAADPDIELVVSDMNMPALDGIEFFRLLRETGVDIPFILLSGGDPGPLLAQEPRVDACLTKDEGLETSLDETIACVLGRRRT